MRHHLMQADLCTMRTADFPYDGQPQARATALSTAPIEALEHPVMLVLGNTWPVVFHLQHCRRQCPQHQVAARRRMRQGVVDEVAEQLVEQRRLTIDPDRLLGFECQCDTARMSQWRHGQAELASQQTEIDALRPTLGDGPRTTLDTRQ